MSRDGIAVEFLVEAPEQALWAMRPYPLDQRDNMLIDELHTGLILEIDGTTVPLTLRHEGSRVQADEHTRAYRLLAHAAHPLDGIHQIRLSTGNLPDTVSFFAGELEVSGDLEVRDCSLIVPAPGGDRLVDTSGTMALGERHRTLSVEIDARTDPLARGWYALTSAADATQPAYAALRRPVVQSWNDGTTSPEITGILASIALFGGSLAPRRTQTRRQRVGTLLALLLGSALACVSPAVIWWLAIALTALLTFAGLRWHSLRWITGPVVGMGLMCTTGDTPTTLAIGALWAVAILWVPRRTATEDRRWRLMVGPLVLGCVCTRALGLL